MPNRPDKEKNSTWIIILKEASLSTLKTSLMLKSLRKEFEDARGLPKNNKLNNEIKQLQVKIKKIENPPN